MSLNILDWIIIGWLVLAFIVGVRFGLVYRIGHLLGLAGGIYLASRYYGVVAHWFGDSGWSRLISFIILFAACAELGGVVAVVLNKFFKIFSWIPLLKTANRLLGGIVALLTQALVLAIVLVAVQQFAPHPLVIQTISESPLGTILLVIGGWLFWFIPFDALL